MANQKLENQQIKSMFLTIGILGALAVVLGAFGAHTLKELISEARLLAYKTGIQYHFYHVLAMCAVAAFYTQRPSKKLVYAFRFFLIGIILFSGSLYLLSTQEVLGLSMKWAGPVTPIGGLAFILGWIFILLSYNSKEQE